jgi:hypothetical protein
MSLNDPNRYLIAEMARVLGDLRDEMVFIGGCAAGLLVSDPAAEGVRPTTDVDAIAEISTYGDYHRMEQRLTQRGFRPMPESGVICRWKHPDARGAFDLMPIEESVLGFSNRWYPEAIQTANRFELAADLTIRLISAPCFVATKLEAFISRGKRDLSSHDLEDILVVIDGRPELINEIEDAPSELRRFVKEEVAALLARPDFSNTLPGLIADPSRSGIVGQRLEVLKP